MNPALATAGAEALSKININKVLAVIGGALFVIVMFVVIKKITKKSKKEADQEAYLDKISSSIDNSNLTYPSTWYESKATGLATDLDAPFLSNGGWSGCNQDGVYDTMRLLETQDDLTKLEAAFGTRELNNTWLQKKRSYTLVEAVKSLMTKKEIKKVNQILSDKGIVTPF